MRNLKKVLALLTAFVLTLSLSAPALAASVEDYTDTTALKYVEQVDVLSALKIMEGNDKNAFSPSAPVTRAEAAAIVARLVLSRKIADEMGASQSRYNDMNQAPWAIKYVETCSDLGIINGTGNGGFNPTGHVTGYEFAKMLLVAIGYGQNKEYVGSSWDLNVAIDANAVNLFIGTDANDMTKPATREQCALYAFNALTGVDMVNYSPLLNTYTPIGLFKEEKGITLGEKLYGLGYATTTELGIPNAKGVYTIGKVKLTGDLAESIGRSIRVWYISDIYGNATAISNVYTHDVVLGSNHYGYTYANMTTPNKPGFVCRADSNIAVYVNGSRFNEFGYVYTTADVGGSKGVEVTFVDTAVNGLFDGVADKVFVLEKQVARLTKDPVVRNISGTTTVMVAGITASYLDANTVIGYENVAYGDVVLFWYDAIGNLHIEKADGFTGKLTGTKRLADGGMGYVIDGETYRLSDLVDTAALTYSMYDISGAPSASYRDFTYYVDNGGYIVAAVPVEEELSDYVVVAEIDVFEPMGVDALSYVQALLVDMHGNKKVVTVASAQINGADMNANGIADSFAIYKGRGTDRDDLINTAGGIGNYAVNSDVAALVGNTFWTYTETANGYNLSSVYAKTVNGITTATGSLTRTSGSMNDIQAGKAHFAAGLTGTTQTVFVIYNKITNTFNAYQGIANVPNVELVATAETGYIEVNGFAQYVFVGKGAIDASSLVSEKTAFLVSTTPLSDTFSDATNTGYGVYQAIVDGELTAIMVKMTRAEVAAEGIGYKTVYYDGNYIVAMADNAKGMAPQNGYVVSGYSLRLADNAAYGYTFTGNTPAYIVDSVRSMNVAIDPVASLYSDNNDTVYVVIPTPTSNVASFIVVYENDPSAAVTITTQPEDAAYTVGDETEDLTVAAVAEDSQARYMFYQWYVSDDADFAHASVIPGATSDTLAVSSETAGVKYYFCKVTHARSGMQTTYAISDAAQITVAEPEPGPAAIQLGVTFKAFTGDAATNSAMIKGMDDGVYMFATIPVLEPEILRAEADDVVFIKYTTAAATGSISLEIYCGEEKVYSEAYTELTWGADEDHFFYVQVLGDEVWNEGEGALHDAALGAGTYTYSIKDANGVIAYGTFVIA